MTEAANNRLKGAVRVVLAAGLCFVIFVAISYLSSGPSAMARGLILRAPDDWFDGVCVCLAALLASGIGTLVYRRPSSRPMAMAIAVGLLFLNLDPVSVWEEVRALVEVPVLPPPGITSQLHHYSAEEWTQLVSVALVRQARLYWVYYLGYMFWTVVMLYSGYLGQYLVGMVLFKRESRMESAVYLAENAGVGLLASIMAGVFAIVLTGALSWMALPESPVIAAAAQPAGVSSLRAGTLAPGPVQPPGPGDNAHATMTALLRSDALPQPAPADRFRVALFVVALPFFVAAYISALSARPRTSTWVACGAVVGVMILPALAARLAVDPQGLPPFFAVLELPPFALAGTAVAAGLVGDWLARLLLARASGPRQSYRPL